eukprot:scaffold124689_cov36-Cyclotella_meneghiniana.AAC.1
MDLLDVCVRWCDVVILFEEVSVSSRYLVVPTYRPPPAAKANLRHQPSAISHQHSFSSKSNLTSTSFFAGAGKPQTPPSARAPR